MSFSIAPTAFHLDRGLMLRLWSVASASARKPFAVLLRTGLVSAACAPHSIDDYLEVFDRTWSLRKIRARIIAVRPERGDATSLWLAPNENWRSFRAGQYVRLSVRIGGVRYDRCFSLSSAPSDRDLRLTIRRLPGSRVGEWAATAAHVGGVVELSQACGDFVLPERVPPRLLCISAGSGITPVMSMLRQLSHDRHTGEITCLHYARNEVIFDQELAEIAPRLPALRFVPCLTRPDLRDVARGRVRFSLEQLQMHAPGWADSETFVCGPPALEAEVRALYEARGLADRLHVERFVPALAPDAFGGTAGGTAPALRGGASFGGGDPVRCRLVFASSGRAVDGHARASLLDQAERAGLQPAHGCRMGICHTCKCKKLSGVVRNQLTGAISSEPGEEIQLCISTPQSDVTLDL